MLHLHKLLFSISAYFFTQRFAVVKVCILSPGVQCDACECAEGGND